MLRAEWTKFRTVRGWAIGMGVAALLMVVLGQLLAGGGSIGCQTRPGGPVLTGAACLPKIPLGPGGEPVDDSYYLVGQPVTGNGSITVRLTSLTGARLQAAGPAHAGAALKHEQPSVAWLGCCSALIGFLFSALKRPAPQP